MTICRRLALAALLGIVGCAGAYSWTPGVPEGVRTVSVPVMRNESGVTEFGNVMTRQLLREFQREGTFRIREVGDSALEVQGTVISCSGVGRLSGRHNGGRVIGMDVRATVRVSVIDKKAGRVLIDNRDYSGRTSISSIGDRLTDEREASGRVAEEIAGQVIEDILNIKW